MIGYSTGIQQCIAHQLYQEASIRSAGAVLAHIRAESAYYARLALVDQAIEVLNLAIKADPVALQSLCQVRVRANEALQNHPTIQIGKDDTLSVIGLINGLFGVDSNGNGPIGRIENTESKEVTGFCRNSNFNFKEV